MKRLSNISESFWGDVHRRSRGDVERKEDDTYGFVKIFNDIKKIPDSELFLSDTNSGVPNEKLWTPYNFGSTSPDQPGLFLDGEKTIALAELLKGTEYHIAWQSDWQALQAAGMEYRKINGYWTYIFKNAKGAELYVPYFGYISAYYAEHPEEKPKITKPVKGDIMSYGALFSDPPKPGWVDLELYRGCYNAKQWHISPTVYTDSFQVRLVKTPGLKS